MTRRYSVLGQLLVWILEGPDGLRPRIAVLLALLGAALWVTFNLGGPWVLSLVAVWLIIIVWHSVRAAQWDYYRSLVRPGPARACPHCGYPRAGNKGETCPECGVHVDEYLRSVGRHVNRNESRPD